MVGIIAISDETTEILQEFRDKFDQLNQPVGIDISADQLLEQIAAINTLRRQVDDWNIEQLDQCNQADAMIASSDLLEIIEAAINDRYDILAG